MDFIKKMLKRPFVRFLFVGGLNTVFGYSVFAFFIYSGFHYSVASLFSTVLGILFNFQTIGRLVFAGYRHCLFLKFLGVYGVTYVFGVFGLFLFDLAGINDYIGGAILILPAALISFTLNKHFVFGGRAGCMDEVLKIMKKRLNDFFLNILNLISFLAGRWWGQMIIIAAPVFFIFLAALLSGKAFIQADMLTGTLPNAAFYDRAFHHQWQPIFWNANTFSGASAFPIIGEFFSPLKWFLSEISNWFDGYYLFVAVNWVLAGFITVRLLKKFNLSGLAAITGGLSYVISIQSVEMVLVNAYVFLPLLFFLIFLNFQKRRWWLIVLGGLAIGAACFLVHINWLIIILTGGFFFAAGVNWVYYKKIGSYLKNIADYLVMAAMGGIIGLVYFAPVYVLTQLSSRQGGTPYQKASIGLLNAGDPLSFVFPDFSLPYLTTSPFLYFGIFGFIFALMSLFVKSRPAKFFMVIFALCLIMAVPYSPLFWLLNKLPVYHYLRDGSRWLFMGVFSASLAAAFGAEHFLSENFIQARKKIIFFVKWLMLALIGLSLAVNLILRFWGRAWLDFLKDYFLLKRYPRTTQLPLEHYYKSIDDLFKQAGDAFSFGNYAFVLPLLMLVIAYLLLRYFHQRREQDRYFGSLVVLVVSLSMILTLPLDSPNISLIDREVLLRYQPQVVKFISQNPGRIFPFMSGFTEWEKLTVPYGAGNEDKFIFEAELLTPKLNDFYNIPSADGYDSLMAKRYGRVIALIGSDRAVADADKKLTALKIPLADKIKLFQERHDLLDMLGVKYVTAGYDLENEGLKKVFETEATKYRIPVYVYENADYLPLVFWAKEARYVNPADDGYKIIIDGKNDFREITFIECSDCKNVGRNEGGIEQIKHDHGHLKLKTRASAEAWLVFNESFFPGWVASIDGKETEIYPANYLFQAILIPAGEHEISFDYKYAEVIKSFWLNRQKK